MYVYVLDLFSEVDLSIEEFIKIAKEDEAEALNILKPFIERYGLKLLSIEPKSAFQCREGRLVELIAKTESGEISIKLIESDNPINVLKEYYKAEKTSIHDYVF